MQLRSQGRRAARAWTVLALALGTLATAPTRAQAQGQALTPQLEGRALIEALRQGGYVILLRHTATDPFVPDEAFDISDCSTQRNLSQEGRRQAEAIGRAQKKLGIRISKVLSSPYCRCVDTGTLAYGEVEKLELLSTGDELSGDEKDARGKQIRKLLGTAPPAGTNTVLITHTGNLLYSFGLQARPEGIAHVFRPSEFGPAVYVGRVLPGEWDAFAGDGPEPGSP